MFVMRADRPSVSALHRMLAVNASIMSWSDEQGNACKRPCKGRYPVRIRSSPWQCAVPSKLTKPARESW
jgi:hypothetical protein